MNSKNKTSEQVGFLVAGGRSRRMGTDKRTLTRADGESFYTLALTKLAEVCDRTVVLLGHGETGPELPGIEIFRDARPQAGPLAALRDAEAAAGRWNLVLAVDLPNLDAAFLERLLQAGQAFPQAQALVPRAASRLQPLCAWYHRDSWYWFASTLAAGRRSFSAALDVGGDRVAYLDPDDVGVSALQWESMFVNLNTPGELEAWRNNG